MFGFDDIAAFTHEVETVYDLVRNGKMPVTKPLIDLTLAARDRDQDDAGRFGRGGRRGRRQRTDFIAQSFRAIWTGTRSPRPDGRTRRPSGAEAPAGAGPSRHLPHPFPARTRPSSPPAPTRPSC